MWEWFTASSVWLLMVSAIVLTVLLFARHWVQESIQKAEKRWPARLQVRATLVYWIIAGITFLLIVLAVAAIILSQEGVMAMITSEKIQAWLLEHGTIIVFTIVVSYLVYQLLKLAVPEIVIRSVRVRGKGRRAKEELAKRSETLSSILTGVGGILVATVAIAMTLAEIGINIAPLLAGAGVMGIAVGFGAQSLVKDMISGLFILMEDQYNKGDVVKIAGIAGLVEEVNLRRTVLRDLDGIVHSIPNGAVTTASNYTKDWSRVNLDVPVAYGEDLDHVIAVINKVGKELSEDEYFGPKIITAPKVLRVNNFGDSGIDIKTLGETKPLMQWEVTGELRKRIKKAFDDAGIEIPWPHVKLYYGQEKAATITCEACSHPNLPGNKFCAKCGTKLGKK
ncbi:mechanosensitive ion channel domain-containing protein [Chloroflexota bacterium]